MVKKIFITGGTGFIGRQVVAKLSEKNILSYCLVRPGSKNISAINKLKNVVIIYADLSEFDKYSSCLKEVDCVFHLAAKINFNADESNDIETYNVELTKKLLTFANNSGVRRFVFASSASTIGKPTRSATLFNENDSFKPTKKTTNMYTYSKYLAEQEIFNFHGNIERVILNPVTVYGEGDHSLNSGFLFKLLKSGLLLFAFPGGSSFVYVGDVADAFISSLTSGKNGSKYLIATSNHSYREIFNTILKAISNKKTKFTLHYLFFYPLNLAIVLFQKILKIIKIKNKFISTDMLNFLFKFRYYDNSLAKKELLFAPKIPFNEAIKLAWNYYKESELL
jgi:nucleoside-diphosphate-sugar epimerase